MKYKFSALVLGLITSSSSIFASTINFEGLPATPDVNITSYSEGGYSFGGQMKISPNSVVNETGEFVGVNFNDTINLTHDSNSLFNVLSVDLAGWSSLTDVYFSGIQQGGGTVNQVISLSTTIFDTYSLSGFTNLTSFSFDDNSASGSFYIDNIELTPSAVPAPAAVWLFGSGLVGFIGLRKKSVKLSEKYA